MSAGLGAGQTLMMRYARGDDRAMVRIGRTGVAICAVLVAVSVFHEALVHEALAQETGTEPQPGVVSPVPPAQPPAAEPPAAQPPAAQPPAAPPPNASYQPGFIDVFGRFIGESAARLNSQFSSQLKSTNETLGNLGSQTTDAAKGAVGTAKDAAGAIIGLPNARIVTGRERCAAAANGAPDCRAAADAACRGKGFASGKSLDTQSAQKCPARVWLSGRMPAAGDCQLETFVTRAVCQ
jgi:hypothetical protein